MNFSEEEKKGEGVMEAVKTQVAWVIFVFFEQINHSADLYCPPTQALLWGTENIFFFFTDWKIEWLQFFYNFDS